MLYQLCDLLGIFVYDCVYNASVQYATYIYVYASAFMQNVRTRRGDVIETGFCKCCVQKQTPKSILYHLHCIRLWNSWNYQFWDRTILLQSHCRHATRWVLIRLRYSSNAFIIWATQNMLYIKMSFDSLSLSPVIHSAPVMITLFIAMWMMRTHEICTIILVSHAPRRGKYWRHYYIDEYILCIVCLLSQCL